MTDGPTQLAAGVLIAVFAACAPTSPRPAAPATNEPPKEPTMAQPAEDTRDFTFMYKAQGGGEAAPGVYAYTTVMKVHGQSGRALMVLNRHNGDLIGKPVGLFAGQLPSQQVADIGAAVEGIKWGELPQPTKGDVNAPMLALDYSRGLKIIQRSFNARNLEFIRSITPVMKRVDELGSGLLTKPARAVEVSVTRSGKAFKLAIKNVGSGPVMIADPRVAGSAPGSTRGSVSVAEEAVQTPGSFALPPIWGPIALQPLGNAPATITLAAGQTHEVETVPWSPPSSSGKYVVQGSWTDYLGPIVDPRDVMPFIPDVESADPKPYVIRGAAFSRYLKVPG